jgi:hypothetical protein
MPGSSNSCQGKAPPISWQHGPRLQPMTPVTERRTVLFSCQALSWADMQARALLQCILASNCRVAMFCCHGVVRRPWPTCGVLT